MTPRQQAPSAAGPVMSEESSLIQARKDIICLRLLLARRQRQMSAQRQEITSLQQQLTELNMRCCCSSHTTPREAGVLLEAAADVPCSLHQKPSEQIGVDAACEAAAGSSSAAVKGTQLTPMQSWISIADTPPSDTAGHQQVLRSALTCDSQPSSLRRGQRTIQQQNNNSGKLSSQESTKCSGPARTSRRECNARARRQRLLATR